ncbi:MAG: polyphosphate kinase 1 [Bacteriovoracaceae bacterium]|nr:polyphosphate kinase 1 [Bacteriovoracaceae bacterium]
MSVNSNKSPVKKKKNRKISVQEHKSTSEYGSSLAFSQEHFFNREISWLKFNRRVLNEASESRNPLLERLRFLTIFANNLDEFFMKRVGGLKRQLQFQIVTKSLDGLTALEQLKQIRSHVSNDLAQLYQSHHQLLNDLVKENIHLVHWKDTTEREKNYLASFFQKRIFPVLTPLSVDPGHPFPFISNLSTSLGVTLKNPVDEEILFSRIKIPDFILSWIPIPDFNANGTIKFISIVQVIKEQLEFLFPQMQILSNMSFRVTRNTELLYSDDDAEDLLEMVEENLKEQKFAEVVRLEHMVNYDPWILQFLKKELSIDDDDVYEVQGTLDYTALRSIIQLPLNQHKFRKWTPVVPSIWQEKSTSQLFKSIRHQDVLVHHPYESFRHTTETLVLAAAADPSVRSIKMTLYRTGDKSPFIGALIRAAESGKHVVCLVELKARFDERRNIQWAQKLEDAGVHVVYGVVGLKTHCKVTLIVREEDNGEYVPYAHIGTGNYHSQTANLYTDFSLFTSHKEICYELMEVFNYLTGRSLKKDYQHLLVAPVNMLERTLELIDKEIQAAKEGREAYIFGKVNGLDDDKIIRKLYDASQAGVKITLFVRGLCCLRPQQKGLSENIRVISIIGRFLEHSRVFYFHQEAKNLGGGQFYLSSADWMFRNLNMRVEVMTPIYDLRAKEILWQMFEMMLSDEENSWELLANGDYQQRKNILGVDNIKKNSGTHERLMKLILEQG